MRGVRDSQEGIEMERELRGVDAEAQGTEAQGDRVSGEQSSMHLKTGNTDEQLGGRCDI